MLDFSANTIPLGALCYVNKGATLQAHDIKYRGEFVKDDLIATTKDSKHPKSYVEGKHITDVFRDDVLYLEYGKGTRNPSKVMEPRFPEMFENPKLIFGKTSGVIIDNENLWCDQSGRVAIPFFYLKNCNANSVVEQKNQGLIKVSEKYDLKFLLAVARSPIGKWHFEHESTDTRDKTPDTIKRLPIRQIEFTTSASKRKAYIDEFTSKVSQGSQVDLLNIAESCLKSTPEQADVVHDLLAYLAEQMIDLSKQKQSEMKRFLSWLEGVLKISVDELTGKSKLRNYIGDYQKGESEVSQEELEDILYKNRNKLGISLSDARPMASIRDEYERSLAVLRPLKSRLAWTDNLIDQIVYRLYGLTEEEIRIVEGKT